MLSTYLQDIQIPAASTTLMTITFTILGTTHFSLASNFISNFYMHHLCCKCLLFSSFLVICCACLWLHARWKNSSLCYVRELPFNLISRSKQLLDKVRNWKIKIKTLSDFKYPIMRLLRVPELQRYVLATSIQKTRPKPMFVGANQMHMIRRYWGIGTSGTFVLNNLPR